MLLPLQKLFTAGALLADADEDGICETVRTTVLWEPDAEEELVVASLALVARLALHVIALHQPLARWRQAQENCPCPIYIAGPRGRGIPDAVDRLVDGDYGVIQAHGEGLIIRGSTARAAAQATQYLARGYPQLGHGAGPLASLPGPGARILRLYVDDEAGGVTTLLMHDLNPGSTPPPRGWRRQAIDPERHLLIKEGVPAPIPPIVALPDRRAHLLAQDNVCREVAPPTGEVAALYDPGGFWHSNDGVAPHRMRTCVVLDRYHAQLMPALAGFIARLALESSQVRFPVAALSPAPKGARERLFLYLEQNPLMDGARLHTREASLILDYSQFGHAERVLQDLSRWPSVWTATATEFWPEEESGSSSTRLPPPHATFTWDFPWEGQVLLDALERALENIPASLPLDIMAGVWEGRPVRLELAKKMQAMLVSRGRAGRVQVSCAFKNALCWIEEEVIPTLIPLAGDIDKIIIHFPWLEASEKGLDLPIRWLQELYPIDEILSATLTLDEAKIDFKASESDFYRLEAHTRQGDLLWRGSRPLAASPVLYLGEPDGRHTQVNQSWLRLHHAVSAQLLHEEFFPGDAQRFWERYRDEFLPYFLEELGKHRDETSLLPPLAGLDIHVHMSQPEQALGIDEERLSPLEALHQDIYFGTLDACRLHGSPHPGPIRPWMHLRPGAGTRATISVHWQPPTTSRSRLPTLVSWHWPAKGPVRGLSAGGEAVEPPSSLAVPEPKPAGVRLPDIPLDRVLGIEETNELVRALASHPRCHAYPVARSYQGREVWALELTSLPSAPLMSRYKLSFLKPPCLIQARKHANEVSSTHANLQIARQLCEGELDVLLKDINVVLIPFANPDGGALHYAMQEEHPHWKLHAARFNAAGMDIYQHHQEPDTPFGESRVYPRLWQRWCPDVSLDDHGVPTHEWLHLFSGYNSPPSFPISYWLPHSLLYAIVLCHEEEKGPWRSLQEDFRWALIREIDQHQWLVRANQRRRRRHQKYGLSWLKEPFAIEVHDHMVFYTWPVRKHRTMDQYPHITYIECITEVTDETAQGKCLETAQKAHYIADCAVLRWLCGQKRSRSNRFGEEWQ